MPFFIFNSTTQHLNTSTFYFLSMSPPFHPSSDMDFSVFRRAAVIVPPLQDFYFTRHRFSSLGATIVADLLNRSGIKADFFNFPLINAKGSIIELPSDMAYLDPFLIEGETGKVSFFTKFRHFGPTNNECVAAILATQPDICLFSVFAFCYADTAIALSQAIKKQVPDMPIVAGGPGPSVYPGHFLGKKGFDYVLTGEAEVSLLPFIKMLDEMTIKNSLSNPATPKYPCPSNSAGHLPLFTGKNRDRGISRRITAGFNKIPNLFWYENNRIHSSGMTATTSDNTMEFAMVKSAESSRTIMFSTMLSRGCLKTCTFCSSRLTSGNIFRNIPVEKIDAALSCFDASAGQISPEKRVMINIEDDNFLADTNYFGNAIGAFKRHFPGAGFIAENGIDYSFLTPAVCEWLLSFGMSKFNLSLASLNPGILSLSKRFINRERYEKSVDFLHHKNIPTVTYFICGFEGDTIESTLCNILYLANQHTLTGISLFYAVPGLPNFTDRSLFDKKSSLCCCGSAAFPWNNSISTETMITAFRLSRFTNLVKSGLFSEKEKKLVELISNKQELYTMVKDKKDGERIVFVENQDLELVKKYFKND
jgi:hypothetical protein